MWFGRFESARSFELRPSRQLLITLGLMYSSTAVLLLLVLPVLPALLSLVMIGWRGIVNWRQYYSRRRVWRLVSGAPGEWFWQYAHGIWREGSITSGSVVHARLVLLELRAHSGERESLVLPPDALGDDAHRRLRVLLWCQSMPPRPDGQPLWQRWLPWSGSG